MTALPASGIEAGRFSKRMEIRISRKQRDPTVAMRSHDGPEKHLPYLTRFPVVKSHFVGQSERSQSGR